MCQDSRESTGFTRSALKSAVKSLCMELSFRKVVFSIFVVNTILFVDKSLEDETLKTSS